MMLGMMVVWDVVWLLLVNPSYAGVSDSAGVGVLGVSMWKYNRYVGYASTVLLLLKVLML